MADYTPEQVEKLAEFVRWIAGFASHGGDVMRRLQRLGITNPDHTIADWLRLEDWADRAARECIESLMSFRGLRNALDGFDTEDLETLRSALAAVIRKRAEDRT